MCITKAVKMFPTLVRFGPAAGLPLSAPPVVFLYFFTFAAALSFVWLLAALRLLQRRLPHFRLCRLMQIPAESVKHITNQFIPPSSPPLIHSR